MFLKSQKNSIYTTIEGHKLNPRDFRLEESTELRVTYTPTDYYFRIYTGPVQTPSGEEQRIYGLYKPSFRASVVTMAEVKVHGLKTWAEMMGHINLWVEWLKSEVEQSDLWAEMEQTPHLFADETEMTDGDEYFTPTEIKQLEERVAEVEQRILALNLPPEVEAAVTATVRDVPVKAKRFTKKELADCIIGSLVKEGFKWGLTTEHMSAAWHGIQYFFTVYIGPHIS